MHTVRPALLAIALCTLALTSTADASTVTFGSDLTGTPIESSLGCAPAASPCTVSMGTVHPGNAYAAAAPISGVITKIRVRSRGNQSFRPRLVRRVSQTAAIAVGTGPLISMVGQSQIKEATLPGGMPVQAGDYLAANGTSTTALGHCALLPAPAVSAVHFVWGGTLPDGGLAQAPTYGALCEILANADIETDADADGFGDDTQDECVGSSGPLDGCPVPDGDSTALQALGVSKKGTNFAVTVSLTPGGTVDGFARFTNPTLSSMPARVGDVVCFRSDTSPSRAIFGIHDLAARRYREFYVARVSGNLRLTELTSSSSAPGATCASSWPSLTAGNVVQSGSATFG